MPLLTRHHLLSSEALHICLSASAISMILVLTTCTPFDLDDRHNPIREGTSLSGADCIAEPTGGFRPECRSAWEGYGSDNTGSIREAVRAAKAYVDATNCDIRTTAGRSPYNPTEAWCGGVVLHGGMIYRLSQAGIGNATYGTIMGDMKTPADSDYAGDGHDQVFGITFETDQATEPRAVLSIVNQAAFVIGFYDRLRHLQIRGPQYNAPIPWCTGNYGACSDTSEIGRTHTSGVLGTGDELQGRSVGWRIEDCIIEGFWGYGVNASWSAYATITRSSIRHNANGAVILHRSLGDTVSSTAAFENGTNGIDLGDSDGQNFIAHDTVYNNGWREWAGEHNGILLIGTQNNRVEGNKVYNTGNGRQIRGINVYQGSDTNRTTANNIITDNTVYGHSGPGIQIGGCASPCGPTSSTAVTDNTLRDNNYAGYQIDFFAGSSVMGTTMTGNVATPPGQCFPPGYQAGNICQPYSAFAPLQGEAYDGGQAVCAAYGALACLSTGSWARYSNVDFSSSPARSVTFTIAVDNCCAGRRIELRLDSPSGPVIGVLAPTATGGWLTFANQQIPISPTTGIHSLYLVVDGGYGAGNIDSFVFSTTQAYRNPYVAIQGESYDNWQSVCSDNGALACLSTGSWARYASVDFGANGARSVGVRIALDGCCEGRRIEFHLDGVSGPLIGALAPRSTGGWTAFSDQAIGIATTTGVHDLYLVVQGGYGAGNIDRLTFSNASSYRDAYSYIEGEGYDQAQNVCVDNGALACLYAGSWAKFAGVDFGTIGPTGIIFNIAVDGCCGGRQIEIRLDSTTGPLLGTLITSATGGWATFADESVAVSGATNVHDVYLVFEGGYGVGNINRFKFNR